jgi:predicted PurR-regulated permease PerM
MKQTLKLPFYAKSSLIIIGLVAFMVILFVTQKIIVPIIYSIIIAIVLNPIVNFLVKIKFNRILAISLTLLLFITTLILIVSLLSIQMMQFGESFPKFIEKFNQFSDLCVVWASGILKVSEQKIDIMIAKKSAELLNESSVIIGHTIMSTGSGLIVISLVTVYIFMILFYKNHLIEFIHKLFNKTEFGDVDEVLNSTKKIIQSYLVGLLLEALIVGVLNSTSLLILGINYAILLGVIGAIVNVIPYIGGIIAIILPMLIAFATKSPTYALLVLVTYLLIQFFDVHYIVPKIVASKVKINALISVIVVLAGGALWGFPGMFISIPLTAIIKVIFDHIEPLKPWGFLMGNVMSIDKINENLTQQ